MIKDYLLNLISEKEKLFFELSSAQDVQQKEIINKKIQNIDLILYRYRNSLEKSPLKEGTNVDLYKYILNKEGVYAICLHSTNEIIGNIEYRGEIKLHKDSNGNVGYETYIDYRRKGYMFEALKLLGELLYDQGIEKIYISANKNNIPSNRLAQKYGGKIIKKYSNFYYVYECDLRVIVKKKEVKVCKK